MQTQEETKEKKKRVKRYSLKAKISGITEGHNRYIQTLYSNRVTLCAGKAGTGKTFCAMGVAADLLTRGLVKKIILVRPLVDCGEEVGILPGDMSEKVGPYMFPLYDALSEFLETNLLNEFLASGVIEVCPLAYMRGRTMRESFIILDEAQNATKKQLKMFLTRFTKTCKVVLTGDAEQSDIRDRAGDRNPFAHVMSCLENIPEIGLVKLTRADIVRDELTGIIDERLGEEFN